MQYRRLGRTDLTVSVVGVGTWQFGGEWGRSFTARDADRILGEARDLGINLVDTAECYGDHLSEELVGAAIQGRREEWIVATKFGHRFHGNFDRTDHWSPDEVRRQLEASLRALATDYVDLYQFHSGPDAAFDQPALWEMLAEQQRAGKIRHLGISVGSNENLHQIVGADEAGAGAIQIVYSRLDREPEEAVFQACLAQDLGVLAREPLAGGLLSGKYRPGTRFTDEDDVRSRREVEEIEARLREVEEIRQHEVPDGVPMAPWALAWTLRHPAVTCVIPGCKSAEQVRSNATAASLAPEDHPQTVRNAS